MAAINYKGEPVRSDAKWIRGGDASVPVRAGG